MHTGLHQPVSYVCRLAAACMCAHLPAEACIPPRSLSWFLRCMQARLEQQQADLEAQARQAGSHSALQQTAADAKSRQRRADQAMEVLQHELHETRAAVVAAETAQREVRQHQAEVQDHAGFLERPLSEAILDTGRVFVTHT